MAYPSAHFNAATSTISDSVDFVFQDGVTFADIIDFSFNLTVNPDDYRPKGSGEADGFVVLSMLCQQNVYDSYPAAGEEVMPCGDPVQMPVLFVAEGEGKHNRKKTFSFYVAFYCFQPALTLFPCTPAK